MSIHALERPAGRHAHLPDAARRQLPWIGAGLAVGFLVPFVFADLLALQRDVYYGIYALLVVGFVVAWARSTGRSIRQMVARRWLLALALGLAVAAVLAFMVLRVEDATSRPDGIALLGAVAWRGVVYGAVDGLLLSSFPILAVFAAFEGTRLRETLHGTLVVGAAAILASVAMTAAYHAGYAQFRSGEIRSPVAGSTVWGLPTLLTLNPIGAPVAHAGMHVSAVLHSYETDLFLPPHG